MTDLKKLAETDRLAANYITALYRLVPCFDVEDTAHEQSVHDIINNIAFIKRFQARVRRGIAVGNPALTTIHTTEPLPASHDATPLSENEQAELKSLIQKHGIYAAYEFGSDIIYVTHESITGRAQALNEREVLEIAKDIDEQTR